MLPEIDMAYSFFTQLYGLNLSSSFLYGKLHFLVTRPFLVVIFGRETPFFGDETTSRRHFWAGNSIFWRRDSFSSPF
ncbi:hypothetical protein [Caldibacillus thermoamylovorans]|uniref:hypothetical protein n=1 Tax=Caldibacillus thermoamylovorans TaxID=35841 RepID=UPI0012600F09|nr:hypothetical protein [Caldibacillus thermoamylovorans]